MEKIFCTYKLPDFVRKMLNGYDVKMNDENRQLSKKEIIKNANDSVAILSMLTDKIDREVIDGCPNLKVISNCAAGYDNVDIDYARKKDIAVTNVPGILTDSTADLAFGLLLATCRRIVEADRFTREGHFIGWRYDLLQGIELRDKALGIIGMGRIGRAVVKRALVFGMNILYHNRKPLSKEIEQKLSARYVSLERLLKESDIISLHVPLTEETHHLLSKKRLKMIKKTAYLINTSRGSVVDENALMEILENKEIAGAGLDVYENEPNVPERLKKLSNVVLLPHIGSATIETRENMLLKAAQNIKSVLNKKEPFSRVV
ncbi:MAG: D-glycerate dehydrogenase [Kosmotoga sp.]|nr:MAG: D-glycerate dehydrogenase [Kosmotoga sp.]